MEKTVLKIILFGFVNNIDCRNNYVRRSNSLCRDSCQNVKIFCDITH